MPATTATLSPTISGRLYCIHGIDVLTPRRVPFLRHYPLSRSPRDALARAGLRMGATMVPKMLGARGGEYNVRMAVPKMVHELTMSEALPI